MQLQFWPSPTVILTLDVLPICRILVFSFAFLPLPIFVFSLRVAIFALFTAMQQTILLRVNNCNNLGLIDARCNAEVSPPAAVRAVHAQAFVQLLTTFRPSERVDGGRESRGERGLSFLFVVGRFRLTSC